MATFLDINPSSPSASSLSSSSPPASPRPQTSSLTPTPRGDDDNDFACRKLPPMQSALTMPSENSSRPRQQNCSNTQSPKRLSVFGSRSRSNTTTSTSSSFKSPASSMTSVSSSHRSSHRSSQDSRAFSSFAAPSEKREGRTKSLLGRGSRILRRQGSKFSISATLTLDEADEMGKHTEGAREKDKPDGLGIFHRSRAQQSGSHHFVKGSISEPFDFQHVTHTNPGQLPPMETTHPHDLATEFSILRAAQRPGSDLKGISAESIYYQDPPTQDSVSMLAPDSQSLFTRSPPASPVSPRSPTSFFPHMGPRATRSVENFSSPPVPKLQKPSFPSIIPPPRISSKFAGSPDASEPTCQNVDALLGPDHDHPNAENKSPRSPPELAAPFKYEVGHVSTSEDSTPTPMRSPAVSHTSELADVPEEDEPSPRRNGPSPKPPSTDFPSTPGFSRGSRRPQFNKPLPSLAPQLNKPLPSPGSLLSVPSGQDELHSPTIPPTKTEPAGPKDPKEPKENNRHKQRSVGMRESVDESWEDDIDYCYEHAAESTSNFDWQQNSSEKPGARETFASVTVRSSSPLDDQSEARSTVSLRAPSASASASEQSTLDLPSTSAVSTSTQPSTVSRGPTPNDPFEPYLSFKSPTKPDNARKPDPIQVVTPPFDEQVSSDPYEHFLSNVTEDPESQFSFYPHSEEPCRSSHCSGSPISKYNSQESMMLSRAASIARKHRSSASTNSVPELIHSSNCSREAVDHEPVPEPPRTLSPRVPYSATHWRSKTLNREATRAGESSPVPSTPAHDRAKSISALEYQESATSQESNTPVNKDRSSTVARKSTLSRKTRTYSLFPSATPSPSE